MAPIDESQLQTSSPLTPKQRYRLTQFNVFLVNIVDPPIASRAARHGYDAEEHRRGWKLMHTASGSDRPFEHHLSQAALQLAAIGSPAVKRLWHELDLFENRWFPRTRDAFLSEVDDPSQRARLETAFFADLVQREEGPLVVGSTETYLARFEALARSGEPGSAEVVAALRKTGLSDEEVARVKVLVQKAQEQAPPPDAPRVAPAVIAAASRAQLEAFEKLNRWYIRWAGVLRPELPYNDALRLGIISQKGRRTAGDEEPGDDAPGGTGGEDDGETPGRR